MSSSPDKIIDLKDSFCTVCGQSFKNANFVLKAKRQVIEIPPIVPIYEEFRQYACECTSCNHFQVADFPKGVNAPIQYGIGPPMRQCRITCKLFFCVSVHPFWSFEKSIFSSFFNTTLRRNYR